MTRTVLLWLHIASVAGWVGANYVQLVVGPRLDRASNEVASAWTRQIMWLGERYYAAVGGLIMLTGIGLVLETDWNWDHDFVWVGIVVVVIGAVMGVGVFTPLTRRKLASLEGGDTSTALAVQRRIVGFALLDTALVLLALYAMVDKWGV